jgi:SAM-dependent methyltransferase
MKKDCYPKKWYLPQNKLFDLNYLKIYEKKILTPERTLREVNFIEKVLNLKPGMNILDLACGAGRHSIELARRGYKVFGQDINPFFLKIAKDMREIPFKNKFDAIINIFTAFGYFEKEKDNQKVIFAVAKALKKRGLFLIDVNNPYYIITHFQPRDFIKINGDLLFLSERSFDFLTNRIKEHRTLIIRNKKIRENYLSIRFYTLPEIISMCEKTGLIFKECYGDYQEKPVDFNTNRWILITQKK